MTGEIPRGYTDAELKALSPEERAEVDVDPRRVLVRTADYMIVEPGGKVARAIMFDPETEVMMVCTGCGMRAAMPSRLVPEVAPRTRDGAVEALCPRCAAEIRRG